MRSQFRFVFVVFYVTGLLIFTIYLHSANNRIYNKLYRIEIEQNRLKQQLWQQQLQSEYLINPAAISQQLDEANYAPYTP